MRTELVAMKKGASNEAALKICWATLSKYCGNVAMVQLFLVLGFGV